MFGVCTSKGVVKGICFNHDMNCEKWTGAPICGNAWQRACISSRAHSRTSFLCCTVWYSLESVGLHKRRCIPIGNHSAWLTIIVLCVEADFLRLLTFL